MKLYHYTIADRLVKILVDGYLKLTPENHPLKENERKAVWFTKSDEWDKTAFYGYSDIVLDNAGRIRITVNAETILAVPAQAEKQYLGDWENLILSALEVGVNYSDWFITFKEVPIKLVEKIELWRNNQWVELPLNIMNGKS